ncbi:TetR/AcrR family transcriptional regulator [Streptomyces sp. Ru73]|uniref:TetR/AcrR family transcriptional regulator n=1 Tax=Streptomyces sp. Ru73 TaxID=2080748 RepID=UPI000CDD1C0F|nr:TetR/AcrR family transcriptional regulator [Streptomyces sp. Ru73]POX36390.1 TetR/AcrR family transcriptional regulator [Streptomyces sp. Ru73]
MNTEPPATPQGAATPVRADAQRNAARVLAAARRAVAATGLDVSYHEIAREAGVGVGTVYRRYPQRDQLMAAVLSDILTELIDTAHQALHHDDAWQGFSLLFTSLTLRTAQNAGLSGSLDQHGGPTVAQQRHELLDLTRRVIERAQDQGRLRRDLAWQEVLRLTGAPAVQGCVLGPDPDPAHGHHTALTVLLDGLRTSLTPAACRSPQSG